MTKAEPKPEKPPQFDDVLKRMLGTPPQPKVKPRVSQSPKRNGPSK